MNVYIVFENIKHSESFVRGVFSASDKAYNYQEELNEEYGDDFTDFSVEAYKLDERR